MEARIRNEVKAVKTSVLQDIVPALNEIAASSKRRKQTLLKKFCKKKLERNSPHLQDFAGI